MTTLRCFILDLRASAKASLIWIAVSFFIFCLMLFAIQLQVAMETSSSTDGMTFNIAFNTADYLTGFFLGSEPYIGGGERRFIVPITWFVFFLLLAIGTLRYPKDSYSGYGKQILIKCRSYWPWWIAKCLWVIFMTIIYVLLALFTAYIFSVFAGSGWAWKISPDLLYILDFPWRNFSSGYHSMLRFFLVSTFVCITITSLQLCMSFIFDSIISLGITASILIASAYGIGPLGIASYAMISRSEYFINGADSTLIGLVICGIVLACSIILGGFTLANNFSLERSKTL